jgi:hypothetical protein
MNNAIRDKVAEILYRNYPGIDSQVDIADKIMELMPFGQITQLIAEWESKGARDLQTFYDQPQGKRDKRLYESCCIHKKCARELENIIKEV